MNFFHKILPQPGQPVDSGLLRVILRLRRKLLRTSVVKHLSYYIDRHKRKSRLGRQPKTFTCFYTGMTLPRTVNPFSGYTVEHLVPKSLLKNVPQTIQHKMKFTRAHRVPSISIINHMIGHAPLVVKFGLRDYLTSLSVSRVLTDDERIEFYVHHTRLFLDQFKIVVDEYEVKHMPWYWNSVQELSHSQELFRHYWRLLTREERALFILKNQDQDDEA